MEVAWILKGKPVSPGPLRPGRMGSIDPVIKAGLVSESKVIVQVMLELRVLRR